MIIRVATANDLEAIRTIYNSAVLTTTATFDTEPQSTDATLQWFAHHDERHAVLVAADADTVIGWASLSRWSDRCAYEGTVEISLYVDEDDRGRGVGQQLAEAVVAHARSAGFHSIIARIAGESDASVHIHKKLGFLSMGTMREAGYKFGRFLDVHFFQLMLG